MLLPKEELPDLWVFGFLAICLYGVSVAVSYTSWSQHSKHPLVGVRSRLEAGVISNFRFYRNAQAILLNGYSKVEAFASFEKEKKSGFDSRLVQGENLPFHPG